MKRFFFINSFILMHIVICFSQVSVNSSNQSSENFNDMSYKNYEKSKSKYYKPSHINAYIDSANTYILSNPQKSIIFTEDALEMSLNSAYKTGEINSYKILGSIYYYYGKNEMAKNYFEKVIDYMSHTGNYSHFYDAYKLMGLVYKSMDSTAKSAYYFNLFLSQAKKENDIIKITDANNNLASLYVKNKQYDQAITLSQSSLNNINNMDSAKTQAQVINSNRVTSNYILGEAYYWKGEKQKAKDHFNSSLENAVKTNSGLNDFDSPNQEQEIVDQLSFQNSIDIPENNTRNAGNKVSDNLNYEIGSIYLKNNDNNTAIAYLEKSSQLKGNSATEEDKQKTYKALSLAYEKAGNIEKALTTYKLYVKSLDSLLAQKNNLSENKLQLSSMLENTAKKVKLLENEKLLNIRTINLLKEEQKLQEDKNSAKNFVIYILLLVIVLMVVAWYYIVKAVRQKRAANQLLELKSLRNQVNPHFVFNALNSVNQFHSMNDELAANRFLTDFSSLMRSIMQASEADFITLNEELNILQLYLKLEHDRFKDKFEYTFNIDEDLENENIYIPPMIIQPFIENAIWHGLRYLDTGGLLRVDICKGDETFAVTIKDNGIGRIKSKDLKTDNQKKYNSTGIKNIEKRIHIIEKRFKYSVKLSITDIHEDNDSGNTGTLVNIIFPAKNNKYAESSNHRR